GARARGGRLHGAPPPARGRRGILRPRGTGSLRRRELDARPYRLHRGVAVRVSTVTAPADASVLTPEALAFVELLQRELGPIRRELLERRRTPAPPPRFLDETKAVRESAWSVAPAPADLSDRRCEIPRPVGRKM